MGQIQRGPTSAKGFSVDPVRERVLSYDLALLTLSAPPLSQLAKDMLPGPSSLVFPTALQAHPTLSGVQGWGC